MPHPEIPLNSFFQACDPPIPEDGIARAKSLLPGHSLCLCLCRGDALIIEDSRGISPLIRLLNDETDLSGFSAADQIVGKAAAMLFVKAGVAAVHGVVTSQAGKDYLDRSGVPCSFDTLAPYIVNRAGTGVCPMEETVAGIDDPDEAFAALKAKLAAMRAPSAPSA